MREPLDQARSEAYRVGKLPKMLSQTTSQTWCHFDQFRHFRKPTPELSKFAIPDQVWTPASNGVFAHVGTRMFWSKKHRYEFNV